MRLTTIFLSGLGLIALASSAPTGTGDPSSAAVPITSWLNTQTQKYHCEGKDVIRCETTARGTCIAMYPCKKYCFLHDNGAACVDMGAPPVKVAVSIFEAKIAARAVSSEMNEHNECSKDCTGVLICRYGFCSTDYYCKSGDECNDGSFSCAPKSPSLEGVKSEIRDVPPQAEVAAVGLDGSRRTPAPRITPAFSNVPTASALSTTTAQRAIPALINPPAARKP
ncbi:hypothetical protein N0V86_003498 [Didymella sp. IMI 355093]|nr:hypothetical protein N0V86_003498 [Didymella sp. IMI 355093]